MKSDFGPISPAFAYAHRNHVTSAREDDNAEPAAKSGRGKTRRMYSDQDLQQRVILFLAASNLPALRRIKVDVEGDAIILRGEVQTFYEKQLTLEFTKRVAGVIRVVDLIEVGGYVPLVEGARTGYSRPSGVPLPS